MATRFKETLPQPDRPCTVLAVNLAHEDNISLADALRGSCWQLKEVQTCREALHSARNGSLHVVLCGPDMPDGNWNTLFDKLCELAAPPAVIVVSRLADERLWVEVLNLGGYDVLMTPFDRSEVLRVLFMAWWTAFERNAERVPDSAKKPPTVEKAASGAAWRCAASKS